MGLQDWTQVFSGCRGHGDDTTKPRSRLVEGQRATLRIGHGPAAFLDQQDPSGQIPFILRLDGKRRLNPSSRDQRQRMGDGKHGPALEMTIETGPAAVPELPGADHDMRMSIEGCNRSDRLAVQAETSAAEGREK